MKESQHKILICGLGSIGRRHLMNIHELSIGKIAFYTPHSDAAELCELAQKTGAVRFGDFNEALTRFRPSVVFICSPTQFHIEQAIIAAQAGAHVFIEKPLSYTLKGISELQNILQENHLQVMIGCNMRFHPGPKKIKNLLEEGAIGDVLSASIYVASYLPRWRRSVPYKESYSADPLQGGVLLDCIHEIDLALWYFGPAKLEHATILSAVSIDIAVDGSAHLLLRHESGVVSDVRLSFIQHTWRRGCEIIGTKGTIEWELRSPPGIPHDEVSDPHIRLYGDDGTLKKSFLAEADRDLPYREQIKTFFSALDTGARSPAPIEDGIRSLAIALEAKEKMCS